MSQVRELHELIQNTDFGIEILDIYIVMVLNLTLILLSQKQKYI